MPGFRTAKFYIEKFGQEAGEQKYREVVAKRIVRDTRRTVAFIPGEDAILKGDAVKCSGCGKIFKRITRTHLATQCVEHITPNEYKAKYPDSKLTALNLNKLFSNTKESIVDKYGNESGKERWESYQAVQSETNTFAYKAAKYNTTVEQFSVYNKSRAATLDNFIMRHGEELGLVKWDAYIERQRYTTSVEYFIEKYGQMDGTIRWEKFYTDRVDAQNNNISFQEISVLNYLRSARMDFVQQYKIRSGRTFKFDYANVDKKLLIEYNGDMWHMNPKKYSAESLQPRTNITAKDIWARDLAKKNIAESAGFTVYYIWESDWKHNRDSVLTKIKEIYSNSSQ
jgi:very-short-patch-repair endonuclease